MDLDRVSDVSVSQEAEHIGPLNTLWENSQAEDSLGIALDRVASELEHPAPAVHYSKLSGMASNGWDLVKDQVSILGMAPIAINLIDAIIKKNPKRVGEISVTAGVAYGVVKTATIIVGRMGAEKALPIVGQLVGGVFAGKDAYAAVHEHHKTRAAASLTATTLYSAATLAAAATTFHFWNPIGWGAAGVVVVAGGAASLITIGEGIYDGRKTVQGWFKAKTELLRASVKQRQLEKIQMKAIAKAALAPQRPYLNALRPHHGMMAAA